MFFVVILPKLLHFQQGQSQDLWLVVAVLYDSNLSFLWKEKLDFNHVLTFCYEFLFCVLKCLTIFLFQIVINFVF